MKTPIYAFDLDRYYDTRRVEALKAVAATKQTPFRLLDLGRIAERDDELVREMSFARPFYAVKANPHESILKLLAHEDLRRAMGRRARRVARERFDVDDMVDRYIQVYDSLR